jgi:hypothetical protein
MKSYACGAKSKKTEHSCCIKEKTEKFNKDNCCQKHKMTGQNEENSCGGNCDNSTCSCPSPLFTLVISDFLVKININSFCTRQTVKYFYTETYHLSGFGFIWTPPNIG